MADTQTVVSDVERRHIDAIARDRQSFVSKISAWETQAAQQARQNGQPFNGMGREDMLAAHCLLVMASVPNGAELLRKEELLRRQQPAK